MAIVTKSIYGSTIINKGYCKRCKGNYFIIDGKFKCCDSLVPNFDKEKFKRECIATSKRKQLSIGSKSEILENQKYECFYCGRNLNRALFDTLRNKTVSNNIHFDHFVPFTYSQDNHKENYVASCSICNQIKYNHFFNDEISARKYILEKSKEKCNSRRYVEL